MKVAALLVLSVSLVALAACGPDKGSGTPAPPTSGTPPPAPPPPPPPPPSSAPAPLPGPGPARPASEWSGFVQSSFERIYDLDPPYAVFLGRHEFDGRLPDWSEAGIANVIAFWRKTYSDASGFTGLSPEQSFERDYLLQVARAQLFWLEDADQPHTSPYFYINGGLDLSVYLTRNYASADTRMRAAINVLKAVPSAAATIRTNLRMPMPASFISGGAAAFNGYADYYTKDVKSAFASVNDPALQQELSTASAAAATAMQELASWMNSNAGTANENFALGSERFTRMLSATQAVNTSIPDLQQIGQADLQRNQAALAAACASFAPGASIQACLQSHAARLPADGAIAAATRQIEELRTFVLANDLVTIPSGGEMVVRASPPYLNAIFMYPPGAFEAGQSVYHIPASASISETTLLFTTVHEAMPGHFLQFLHARRSPSLVGRLLVTGGFAEGWAHYAEEMMWDAGLRGTAEARIGLLLNALLRNCRFMAAIGMHTQGMSRAAAQTMFQQQCYQSQNTAKQQVDRGTWDPGYLDYTLNKLLIMRLREDWTASRGGRAAWKSFHDQFLSYGGPPVPLVRGAMLGTAPAAVF